MTDMRPKLLIVGAGGFGREVLSYIDDDNPIFNVTGFLDSRADALNGMPRSFPPIVGDPLTYVPSPGEVFLAALGDPQARFKFTAELRRQGAEFPTVMHPRHNVNIHSRLGRGCIVGPRASISVEAQVGDFTCIQEYTVVGHDAQIGDWCQINSHCTIAGRARIGNFVTIHPNCVITNRAVIGDGVTVAPGSVVIGNIPPNITVLGNPARRFSFR